MLLSVYTPSHDLRWIDEAYASLASQSYPDWEWVLVLNGDAARGDAGSVPDRVREDRRVRVLVAPEFADNGHVGALKRFAVSQCKGDIFVELDHDDMLAPQALNRVAVEIGEGAGFVYSDFIQLRSDGSCPIFGPKWGWESYRAEIGGREYEAVRAFDPMPASLMHIWWAPNHVRAWSRSAYTQAGGYDAGLKVCDDLDLIAKTYIAGATFAHIGEPLYLYRLRVGKVKNTHLECNAEIQRLDQEISNRHFYALVDEWCRREKLERVEVKIPGRKLELAEGAAGVIRAYDVLHRVHPEHVPAVMNDFYRALAPGGWLMIRVPSSESAVALADPTARSYWNHCSWWFYTRMAYAARVPGLAVRFQDCRVWDAPATGWDKAQNQLSSYADLCALKGQRQPGLKHI